MEINNQKELINIDNKWKSFKFDKDKVEYMNIANFITDKHIDIIVKYLYVKAYIENKNLAKYKRIYEEMQIKRVGKCNLEEFNHTIESFRQNGYLKEYPIPINYKGRLLNGSHRLSCCLYFNINPYVYKIDEEDHDYPLSWFKENDFKKEIIKEILKTKEELLAKYINKKIILPNIYTAMITAIVKNKFDYKYFQIHAEYLKKNKIKGLFLCGNTGSGMSLNFKTKKSVLEYADKFCHDFSLIFHVGSQNIIDIEKTIKLTNSLNIDCIASMPPYEKINTFPLIKKYYEYIANISQKPILIYHIPKITSIDLSVEELTELLNINNVIGIKYTDSNLVKLKELSKINKDKYIYFGQDNLLLDGLTNGATGGIGGCYNLLPSFIYKIVNGSNQQISLKYQNKLNFAIKALRKKYPTLPGDKFVKQALKIKSTMNDKEFYEYLEKNND